MQFNSSFKMAKYASLVIGKATEEKPNFLFPAVEIEAKPHILVT